MTLENLSNVVHMSKSHLSRIENADYMPPPDLPAQLDAAFDTDGIFGELYEVACREVHPDRYRRRMELEAKARSIEEYSCQMVPGLVQTEAYAREIFVTSLPKATPDEVEDLVGARMARKSLLTTSPTPDLFMVLDEAVLRRPVGGPMVMRSQLSVLVELADTPNTTVQVMPFAHGAHALMGGSLTLLTLTNKEVVAYEESIGTGTLMEDEESVAPLHRAYHQMRAYALPPRDSAAFIRSVMEDLPT